MHDFLADLHPSAMLCVFNGADFNKKAESTQQVKKRVIENKTEKLAAHGNRVEDFEYDHEVVYTQNSIVNVDAVLEDLYQSWPR
jgi:hypothetical protein